MLVEKSSHAIARVDATAGGNCKALRASPQAVHRFAHNLEDDAALNHLGVLLLARTLLARPRHEVHVSATVLCFELADSGLLQLFLHAAFSETQGIAAILKVRGTRLYGMLTRSTRTGLGFPRRSFDA